MSALIIRKASSFNAVPDDVLTDVRLSLSARAVLAWLVGRPDGWQIQIGHMQRVLHFSEEAWAGIRKQLAGAGYFRQTRQRGELGRMVWQHEVIYPPIPVPAIPGKPRDGATRHGAAMPGQPRDVNIVDVNKEVNQRKRKSKEAAAEEGESAAAARHPPVLEDQNPFGIVIENAEDQRRYSLLLKVLNTERLQSLCDLHLAKGGRRLYTSQLMALLPDYEALSAA